MQLDSNTQHDGSQPEEKISYLPMKDFIYSQLKNSKLAMIWGDVGTGKTTVALRNVKRVLEDTEKKVFFLYTKQSSMDQLIARLLPASEELRSRLLFWETQSLKEQLDIILQWQIQIDQLNRFFNRPKVGFIVVDEIASQYLLELGTSKKNEHINQDMTLILATLAKICKEKKIPILLLNNFTKRKKNENDDTLVAIPYGGKIISYWTDLEIKVGRTPQISRMKFTCTKKPTLSKLPHAWTWVLKTEGFF